MDKTQTENIAVYVRVKPTEEDACWKVVDNKQIYKADTGKPSFVFGLLVSMNVFCPFTRSTLGSC
jgi:hypothetical protein